MGDKHTFTVADFAVFGATLVISTAVGLYHAWKFARKKREASSTEGDNAQTREFLVGNQKMPIIPVALSVMTTFVSGFSLLGVPAEIYQRGALMWLYQMMGGPTLLICALVFLPVFYRLRPISIYEYFEVRFQSRFLRRLGATLFLLNTLFYMAVVMYAPAVALSGVTDVRTWPFILIVGGVCTFYTTLGGLKGVVWTDTLQAGFMYGGVLALVIKGSQAVGGLGQVFEIASKSGRLAPLGFIDPNPAQYSSLWIAIGGGLSFWLSLYGVNQMAIQRYCSLANLRQARAVIALTAPIYVILLTLCSLSGLVMLAHFWGCDPIQSGEIQTKDQLVILFVVQTLGSVQGLPGLFLACLFSGTLSTVSGGINAMAAVTWEDFLKHFQFFKTMTDARATVVNKILVFMYGTISIGLAFAAGPMGGIISAAISMMGSLAGPLVGLFVLGVCFPKAHKHGATVACVVGIIVCTWITMGSVIEQPYSGYVLNVNDSKCTNALIPNNGTSANLHYGNPNVSSLYRVSSFLFALIGIVTVIAIGVPASYIIPYKQPETTAEPLPNSMQISEDGLRNSDKQLHHKF